MRRYDAHIRYRRRCQEYNTTPGKGVFRMWIRDKISFRYYCRYMHIMKRLDRITIK